MSRIRYQEAIGLRVKQGRSPIGPAPLKTDLIKLYVKENRSIRDVAATLACSKDAVHRGLQKYGIKARTGARRGSVLLKYRLSHLKAAIREKGVRGTARELGVDKSTLRHHLKVRKGP